METIIPLTSLGDLTNDELQFMHMISLSNFSSNVFLAIDASIETIIALLTVMNNTTQFDISTRVHLHGYTYNDYMKCAKTIIGTPPLDTTTFLMLGRQLSNDLELYDVDYFDIIMLVMLKDSSSMIPIISQAWKKLKCNGMIILKGIERTDTERLNELQKVFGSSITIPNEIRINIHLIEQSKNVIIIKKPCY